MMTNKENILNALRFSKKDFSQFGIQHIGLFGSYARDEQVEHSDIDLLIDFEPTKESFDNYMGIYDLIEQLFKGEKVEVVTRNGLSSYIGPKILNEVIYV